MKVDEDLRRRVTDVGRSTLGEAPITNRATMSALSLMIRPTDNGWGVYLSDGQELMRYRGLCAKRHALRYLQHYTESIGRARRPQAWWWQRRQAG